MEQNLSFKFEISDSNPVPLQIFWVSQIDLLIHQTTPKNSNLDGSLKLIAEEVHFPHLETDFSTNQPIKIPNLQVFKTTRFVALGKEPKRIPVIKRKIHKQINR